MPQRYFALGRSYRSSRPNTSIKSRDAQDPVPILVTGQYAVDRLRRRPRRPRHHRAPGTGARPSVGVDEQPQPTPAVPAVPGDPRADPAAVAPRVRPARVLPGEAVDVGQFGVLPQLLDVAGRSDIGVPVAFIEQVEATRGSWRMCSSRLRPSSMFTSTPPSSRRYQVAVDTGRPSRRRVAMTAGSS
jgi:hypothetical protein